MATCNPSNYTVHTLLRARDCQHRPQFEEVCDWWRGTGILPVARNDHGLEACATVGRGVSALVGMGGAGKTAFAERFLNELLHDKSTARQRVSPAESTCVYSFYGDDKPENFFRHLQVWLEGTSAPDKQKSPTQLMFDIQQHQGLISWTGWKRCRRAAREAALAG